MKTFSITYPDYRARLSGAYFSRHEGVFVADSWDWGLVPGEARWTKDHPLTEFHYEPLLWGDQFGSPAIRDFSDNFFSQYPGARLELLQSFADLAGRIFIGGVYAIHLQELRRTCNVRAVIVLKPDDIKLHRSGIFTGEIRYLTVVGCVEQPIKCNARYRQRTGMFIPRRHHDEPHQAPAAALESHHSFVIGSPM